VVVGRGRGGKVAAELKEPWTFFFLDRWVGVAYLSPVGDFPSQRLNAYIQTSISLERHDSTGNRGTTGTRPRRAMKRFLDQRAIHPP
jgi:hypothetical protein